MGLFDQVLLTVDYDRTLTGPDSAVPQKNLEAIGYFMENGGAFTLNTGRSLPYAREVLANVPRNAPALVYNGSVAVDADGSIRFCQTIDLPVEQTMEKVCQAFPDLNVVVQGLEAHYHFQPEDYWKNYVPKPGSIHRWAEKGMDYGPFIKFNVYGGKEGDGIYRLFTGTEEEIRRMDEAVAWLEENYGDKLVVFRSGARLLNVHAKGVSKLTGARKLQKLLGKQILVCVGDEGNDLPMLEGADYAFCPADGNLAHLFPNVCNCADGAVAEVIYEKIPDILKGLSNGNV
ncbi:MAG: HAD-IIB family hydrolase [Oscillospiraceae bacterium]|nr:HAD-IIB family hydrolase [Oscillospiraceae bacterium]